MRSRFTITILTLAVLFGVGCASVPPPVSIEAPAAQAAPSLEDRAGYWLWLGPHIPGAAFDDLLVKMDESGQNFTALGCFEDPDGSTTPHCRTQAYANRLAHRIGRFNAHGTLVVAYIWNRWEDPAVGDHLPEFDREWIKTLSEATAGLDLIWSPCLEPLPGSVDLVERTLATLREIGDTRPVLHNGNHFPPPPGFDYYDLGTGHPDSASHNGDHNRDWLRAKSEGRQASLIAEMPDHLGLLMVTQMFLDDEDHCLPGWGGQSGGGECDVADWDSEASWLRMGEAAGGVDPDPDPDAELRRAKDLLGWEWDRMEPRWVRRSREAYVNDQRNIDAMLKAMADSEAGQ